MSYTLNIHSNGSWGFVITGLTEAELDCAIERIEYAKKKGRRAYWQITTRANTTTRIYGDQIAGFNYEEAA